MTTQDYTVTFKQLGKEPRYYQENAVKEVARHLLDGHRRILITGPTGSGKTMISKLVCTSKSIRDALDLTHGKIRVLFVSGKHRLNRQAIEEFSTVSDNVEIIPHSSFVRASKELIDTIDIVCIDEAHHESSGTVQHLLEDIHKLPIFGFTATENRADGLLLKFSRFVPAICEKEATDKGFIEQVGINTIMDLGTKDKTIILEKLLASYHTHMGNTIVFMEDQASVDKMYRITKNKLKLSCAKLDQNSSESDLDEILHHLATGKIQFVFNCRKISEGVDTPNVSCVILASNSQSEPDILQKIGRARRPDSPCSVWEFVSPYKKTRPVRTLLSSSKFEYLLNLKGDQWEERLLSGKDEYRGQMSELRLKDMRPMTKIFKETYKLPKIDFFSEVTPKTRESIVAEAV